MLRKSCQSSGAFVTTEVAEEPGSLFEWKGSIISSGLGPERSIFHVWRGGGGFQHQGSPGHYHELWTGLKELGKFPVWTIPPV